MDLMKSVLCLPNCKTFTEILLEMAGSYAFWDCLNTSAILALQRNLQMRRLCPNKLSHFVDKSSAETLDLHTLVWPTGVQWGGNAWERRSHSFFVFCFKMSSKLLQNVLFFWVRSHTFLLVLHPWAYNTVNFVWG